MSITVQLPKFEGPLGLLLYLIRKEEMDIMDIKIHEITKQYFDYIKLMKELDLEVAGEFVAMASTLIQIKSRMLLPQYDENGEVIETEDPRKELVQKLLEYQKYQEAAKLLYDRPLVGRDVWLRGTRESLAQMEEEIVLEENALFSLIGSYRKALRSMKKKFHQVAAKAQSIASRVLDIKDRLIPGKRITMMELVTATEERARQALITFLSLLELGKMGFVSLYQSENYGDIWVDTKKPIETDVLARVEEYDSMRADEVAAKMMADSAKIDLEAELAAEEAAEQASAEAQPVSDQLGFDMEMAALDLSDIASDDEILAAEAEDGLAAEPILDVEGTFALEPATVEENATEVAAESEMIAEEAVVEAAMESEEAVFVSEEAAIATEEIIADSEMMMAESEVIAEEAQTVVEEVQTEIVAEIPTAELADLDFEASTAEVEEAQIAAVIEADAAAEEIRNETVEVISEEIAASEELQSEVTEVQASNELFKDDVTEV
ncbi:ScpA family protein [Bdellovibrio sp. NC01]|uniref:segregation and condensation protein A n=1 Tax=Bdellovibrio sp. NC01 TaxID=2220073 RepID=UPI001158D002|nr:segregation/condensation protein A [Bdellovibrio sp. NC01]QDK37785.1 hypothetical protein DOE51_09405 [Bdellovibrio sp. NC01]